MRNFRADLITPPPGDGSAVIRCVQFIDRDRLISGSPVLLARSFGRLLRQSERSKPRGVFANSVALGLMIRGDASASLLLPFRDGLRPIVGFFLRMISQGGLPLPGRSNLESMSYLDQSRFVLKGYRTWSGSRRRRICRQLWAWSPAAARAGEAGRAKGTSWFINCALPPIVSHDATPL